MLFSSFRRSSAKALSKRKFIILKLQVANTCEPQFPIADAKLLNRFSREAETACVEDLKTCHAFGITFGMAATLLPAGHTSLSGNRTSKTTVCTIWSSAGTGCALFRLRLDNRSLQYPVFSLCTRRPGRRYDSCRTKGGLDVVCSLSSSIYNSSLQGFQGNKF